MTRGCEGCFYRSKERKSTCDYMYLTGFQRGCPAGEGCTRKMRKKRTKQRISYAKRKAARDCSHEAAQE
ncbi:MAG: hypothetical protein HFE39_07285 [Clostridiales bacterium]|jgi:hypothetical protein|nr:hypothetical protein [Clostridiales bacterium]